MDQPFFIDGFGPLNVVRPLSTADLGDVVRRAAAEKSALYPVGGGTGLDLGNAPTRPGLAVDLRGLDQVIDFPARDMTITVQAGITIAKLQELLAPENLRLPIDVPRADRATLGGILAANVSGPRRAGFGTLRDYVIGISAVNDEGHEFKAGGRVVKNVAGYDLCKLLVGSLGTLGIITQATLKLRPCPEEQALVTLGCDAAGLGPLLDQLHESKTRPVCLEVLNPDAADVILRQAGVPWTGNSWAVIVGYEGNADAVNWQVQQLVKEMAGATSLEALVGFTAEPLWRALAEWPASSDAAMKLQASMLPGAVAAFCGRVHALPSPSHLRAHGVNGIVQAHVASGLTPQDAAAMLTAWRQDTARPRVVVTRCPAEWKKTLSVWGPAGADLELMREVKRRFDPGNLFNPGRGLVD